jgi:anti-sigma B factor antagonist
MSQEPVTFAKIGEADLVRLAGEIDMANAREIGQEIGRHTDGTESVLVDLTAVSFLDSAGVRLLDALVGEWGQRGARIRLVVGESGPARMTLQLCAFRDDLLLTDLDRAVEEVRP